MYACTPLHLEKEHHIQAKKNLDHNFMHNHIMKSWQCSLAHSRMFFGNVRAGEKDMKELRAFLVL